MPEEIRVVLTTFPDEEIAARIARQLIEERHAACASILPGVRSLYRWEGEIEDAREVMVLLKTATATALADRLKALHPYKVPEIIVLKPDAIHADYAQWVAAARKPH